MLAFQACLSCLPFLLALLYSSFGTGPKMQLTFVLVHDTLNTEPDAPYDRVAKLPGNT